MAVTKEIAQSMAGEEKLGHIKDAQTLARRIKEYAIAIEHELGPRWQNGMIVISPSVRQLLAHIPATQLMLDDLRDIIHKFGE